MASVVLFTRDLRVRDHPALVAAAERGAVVALFVADPALASAHRSANRTRYLRQSLADLHGALGRLGVPLVLRRGDAVTEALRVATEAGADAIHLSADAGPVAQRRDQRLRAQAGRVAVESHPGVAVVPPGELEPGGGGEFKVFTPYYRRWSTARWRAVAPAPQRVESVPGVSSLTLDEAVPELPGAAPGLPAGGETAALAHLKGWAAEYLGHYEARHDDLAGAATSQISAALHFGCLSPLEVASRLGDRPGGSAFVRQLCWRDFFLQILAARPDAARADYRDRGDHWREDPESLAAWQQGRTGYPVVDAGMRQLLTEGFMHNRARMVVASFLTKDLGIDWRLGAAHFMANLVDGDVASNQLNWQWVAGTGTDTNPHRIFNPTLQSRRFDPEGGYVRRHVPELAAIAAPEVHEPSALVRQRCGYPAPLVDHHEAIAEYRARRRMEASP